MASEDVAVLLTGMLAGLLSRDEVRGVLRDFSITPTESRQTLMLYFPESRSTYRVDVAFVANFMRLEDALNAIESGEGR